MTRARGICATLTMVVALAGCASPSDPDDARPTRYVETATVSPEAQKAYGEKAQEAYREVTALVMARSLQNELLDPQRTTYTREELSEGILDHLAPAAQTAWTSYVDQAVAGDKHAQETVDLLRVHSIAEPALTVPSDGKVVSHQAVSGGTVDLADATAAGARPLTISFDHSARLDYRAGRTPYQGSVDRKLTFTVLPTGDVERTATPSPTTVAPAADAQWLITSFAGATTFAFDDAPAEATPSPTQ